VSALSCTRFRVSQRSSDILYFLYQLFLLPCLLPCAWFQGVSVDVNVSLSERSTCLEFFEHGISFLFNLKKKRNVLSKIITASNSYCSINNNQGKYIYRLSIYCATSNALSDCLMVGKRDNISMNHRNSFLPFKNT
jgi:hypothetical protein